MFEKTKKSESSAIIDQPAGLENDVLKQVSIHTIPSEFYDGGVGGVQAPQKKQQVIQNAQSVSKPALVATPPMIKKPILDAHVQGQLNRPHPHRGLMIGGLIGLLVLIVVSALVYWWFVIRIVEPEPIAAQPSPSVVVTLPETVESDVEPELEPTLDTEKVVAPVYPFGLREYQLSKDTDLDGLTDVEEQQIYGSDITKPDDDSDGFVDGHEVFHLYNPAAKKPVALIDSGLVYVYENDTFGYSVLHPAVWSHDRVDAQEQVVLFTSATGEYVEIVVHPLVSGKSLLDWYNARVPAVTSSQVRSINTKSGLEGLLSPDSLSLFIERAGLVYELRYDIGVRFDANFMRTFVMMYNSFHFTSDPLFIPDEIQFNADAPGDTSELFPMPETKVDDLVESDFDKGAIEGGDGSVDSDVEDAGVDKETQTIDGASDGLLDEPTT